MVAAAVRTLGRRDVDVVLVVRGGGARSDLATFDTEVVARAIATCPRPVLTGLGHEVDRSVADEVAHLALKTPTACAGELIAQARYFEPSSAGCGPPSGTQPPPASAADRRLVAESAAGRQGHRRSVDAGEAGLRRAAQALARQSRLAASTSHALVTHDARRTAASTLPLAQHSSALSASGQRLAPFTGTRPAGSQARRFRRCTCRPSTPPGPLARGRSITRTSTDMLRAVPANCRHDAGGDHLRRRHGP